MTSPLETIAARVLAGHLFDMGGPGVDPSCNGFGLARTCDWTHPWDRPLHELWSEHRAHVATEIARAVAEDEGLESLLWDVIATARDAGPRLSNDADTGDVTAAVIDALTREEDR